MKKYLILIPVLLLAASCSDSKPIVVNSPSVRVSTSSDASSTSASTNKGSKTFKNPKLGYSVGYPGDWDVSGVDGDSQVSLFSSKNPQGANKAEVAIFYFGNVYSEIQNYALKLGATTVEELIAKENLTNVKAITVDSQPMYGATWTQAGTSGYFVLGTHNDHLYEILFNDGPVKGDDLSQPEKDILAGFKFID